jgi:hypothetical protein
LEISALRSPYRFFPFEIRQIRPIYCSKKPPAGDTYSVNPAGGFSILCRNAQNYIIAAAKINENL